MPLRTFNFTGRKRLRRNDVQVTVYDSGRHEAAFDAELKLGGYGLPGDAEISVEAYRQTRYMRFPFGRVAAIKPPADRRLTEFDSPEGVLFRVKIVSASDPGGVLLAEADRVRPRRAGEGEVERIPLLPVAPSSDLGHEIYRVDFDGAQTLLLVNDSLGDWQNLVRDPLFAALVYPAALRAILTRIVLIERHHDTDDADDWRSCWLRFAVGLPGVVAPPEEDEGLALDDWIDDAVEAFSRQTRMLEMFEGAWVGGKE
jgi:hypothetical protein